jgi:hypothetical protein
MHPDIRASGRISTAASRGLTCREEEPLGNTAPPSRHYFRLPPLIWQQKHAIKKNSEVLNGRKEIYVKLGVRWDVCSWLI